MIEQELEKICFLEAKTRPDLLSIEEAAELYEQIERVILLSIMQEEEDELNQRLLKKSTKLISFSWKRVSKMSQSVYCVLVASEPTWEKTTGKSCIHFE